MSRAKGTGLPAEGILGLGEQVGIPVQGVVILVDVGMDSIVPVRVKPPEAGTILDRRNRRAVVGHDDLGWWRSV
jgi:hypothetical protein